MVVDDLHRRMDRLTRRIRHAAKGVGAGSTGRSINIAGRRNIVVASNEAEAGASEHASGTQAGHITQVDGKRVETEDGPPG